MSRRRKAPAVDITAKLRAGAIWRIRFYLLRRLEPTRSRSERIYDRERVREAIEHLRAEGPGPVEPIETVAPGPCSVPETWWGLPC